MTEKLFKKLTALIFILAFFLGLVFMIIMPIWEGFDEPVHYAYIQYLGEHGRKPIYKEDHGSEEIRQTLFSFPLNRNLGILVKEEERLTYENYWQKKEDYERPEIISTPSTRSLDSGYMMVHESQHPPLGYALFIPVYQVFKHFGFYANFFALRFFALLCFLLGLFILKKSFSKLSKDKYLQLIMLSMIVLNSMTYIHLVRISNESLVFILYSLIFYFLVKIFKKKSAGSWRDYLFLGLSYGLGLQTKSFFMATLPALLFAFGYKIYMSEERTEELKRVFVSALLLILIGASYYAHNLLAGRAFSGLQHGEVKQALALTPILSFNWLKYFTMIATFFMGAYGWHINLVSKTYYIVYGSLLVLMLSGFLRAIYLKLVKKVKKLFPEPTLAKVTLVGFFFFLLVLAGMSYQNYIYNYPNLAVTGGWYFMSLAGFLVTILACGTTLIFRTVRAKQFLLLTLWSVAGLWFVILFSKYLIPVYYGL